MKRIIFVTVSMFIILNCYSQQSNFFPPNGNVGIGTSAPKAKLDVEVPYGPNQDEEIRMGYYPSGDASKYFGLGFNFKVDAGGSPSKYIVDYNNGTKYYTMTFKEGNIGIGRTNPITKLDVEVPYGPNQDEEIRMGYYPSGDASKYFGLGFNFKVDAGGSPSKYIVNYENGTKYYSMTFRGENVGIGTSDPGNYKLAVQGTIGAREVKVTLDSWSDFVFESNYNLKNLEEIEAFINDNNRLPDIPSETEVVKNGINLGEMDAKLLQKIEELTLHMIEINKEVKILKQENIELKEEITELKSLKQ